MYVHARPLSLWLDLCPRHYHKEEEEEGRHLLTLAALSLLSTLSSLLPPVRPVRHQSRLTFLKQNIINIIEPKHILCIMVALTKRKFFQFMYKYIPVQRKLEKEVELKQGWCCEKGSGSQMYLCNTAQLPFEPGSLRLPLVKHPSFQRLRRVSCTRDKPHIWTSCYCMLLSVPHFTAGVSQA